MFPVEMVPVFVPILLLLSPTFHPAQAAPAPLRPLLEHNPLYAAIEAISAASADLAVNWTSWIAAVAWVLTAGVLGYALFQHSRDEFAEVR